MKKVIKLVCVSLLLISICKSRFIEKSLSVTVLEESVNDMRFAHRTDIIDGKIQDIWAINGHAVPYDEYLDTILDAEREERRALRKLENEKRRQEAEFKISAQSNAIKKIIRIKINEIMHELAKVKEPLLAGYLKFDTSTFATQEDLDTVSEIVENAKKKCQEGQELSYSILNESLASLEGLPEKLHKLYQDSVNYAIKTCDDTRYLKDLLSLIS